MRFTLLILSIVFGVFMVVYGSFLSWDGDLFLRFHDSVVERGTWNRNAPWRKKSNGLEFKLLGLTFIVFGVLILVVTWKKVLALQ